MVGPLNLICDLETPFHSPGFGAVFFNAGFAVVRAKEQHAPAFRVIFASPKGLRSRFFHNWGRLVSTGRWEAVLARRGGSWPRTPANKPLNADDYGYAMAA